MSNLFTYNGANFDLDKMNCIKPTSKKISDILEMPGIIVVGEGGVSRTYYGSDYSIENIFSNEESFLYKIFHKTDTPFATLHDRVVNLHKVENVAVAFNRA